MVQNTGRGETGKAIMQWTANNPAEKEKGYTKVHVRIKNHTCLKFNLRKSFRPPEVFCIRV